MLLYQYGMVSTRLVVTSHLLHCDSLACSVVSFFFSFTSPVRCEWDHQWHLGKKGAYCTDTLLLRSRLLVDKKRLIMTSNDDFSNFCCAVGSVRSATSQKTWLSFTTYSLVEKGAFTFFDFWQSLSPGLVRVPDTRMKLLFVPHSFDVCR